MELEMQRFGLCCGMCCTQIHLYLVQSGVVGGGGEKDDEEKIKEKISKKCTAQLTPILLCKVKRTCHWAHTEHKQFSSTMYRFNIRDGKSNKNNAGLAIVATTQSISSRLACRTQRKRKVKKEKGKE